MKKFAFLILNYMNWGSTVQCAQEIIAKFSDLAPQIVIVDNGSNNDSLGRIQETFSVAENVTVLSTKRNLGYSAGNNYGYDYIRKNIKPDYLIVTNSDILFVQDDFLSKIVDAFQANRADILGPDIVVKASNEHQSPIGLNVPTISNMETELNMYEFYEKHPYFWPVRRWMQNKKNSVYSTSKIFRSMYSQRRGSEQIDFNQEYFGCCLQGSCVIFSRNFIRNEQVLFSPDTFLYCEEILLQIKALRKKYKIEYCPILKVQHADSATIRKITSNSLQRAKFTLKFHVSARKIVINELRRFYQDKENE